MIENRSIQYYDTRKPQGGTPDPMPIKRLWSLLYKHAESLSKLNLM